MVQWKKKTLNQTSEFWVLITSSLVASQRENHNSACLGVLFHLRIVRNSHPLARSTPRTDLFPIGVFRDYQSSQALSQDEYLMEVRAPCPMCPSLRPPEMQLHSNPTASDCIHTGDRHYHEKVLE